MKHWLTFVLLVVPQFAFATMYPGTDPRQYSGPAWSPYLVGAGIGVLSWLTFYFSDKAIGASSFYESLAGMIGKAVAPHHTASLKYYKENPPKLDWAVVFVACAIIGAFIAAWTGSELTNEWLHPMWVARFGDNIVFRAVVGFSGGVLMAFGAHLAGGCTSGHSPPRKSSPRSPAARYGSAMEAAPHCVGETISCASPINAPTMHPAAQSATGDCAFMAE